MSETKTFLGIRQVLATGTEKSWDKISNDDKKGYLWLVRSNIQTIEGNEIYDTDIYFGTRRYAHYSHEDDNIDEIILTLKDAGIIDESGNTVDIASLISDAQLTNGDAITISGGTIYVNVADATDNEIDDITTNKNFLKINSENELEVKGVDADATVTSEDITIAGGPLAEMAKKAYTDGTLPAGTSMQDFLLNMLCVEQWATSVTSGYSFTASVNAPTLTVKNGSTTVSNNETVEIGTKLTVSELSSKTSSASQSISAKTMTYGYKLYDTETSTYSDYTSSTGYTQNLTPVVKSTDVTLKVNYGNFKKNENDAFTSIDEVSKTNENVPSQEVFVSSGSNVVTAYQSGYTYQNSTDVTSVDIYIATNLKNYYKTDKETDNVLPIRNPWTSETNIIAHNSSSITVKGARGFFYGWMEEGKATSEFTSNDIRSLQSSGLSISATVYNLVNTSTASEFVIAFPSSPSHTLSKVLDGANSDMDITSNFTKTTVSVMSANDFDSVSYDVWYYIPVGNAWQPRTLKITIG